MDPRQKTGGELRCHYDGIDLGNILHHKSVKSKILPYSKDQSVPIISYVNT